MTNLSRLSDVPNKPVNIVYLQSSANNGGGGPSYSSNNGYGDRAPFQSQEYNSQTMALPSSSGARPYSSPPSQVRPQYHPEEHYRSPQSQSQYPQSYSNREREYSPEQQQRYHPPPPHPHQSQAAEDFDTEDLAAQLAAIRQKLDDKRKRMEMEKGRMEAIASKQQAKLGKVAYLKAMNKVSGLPELFFGFGRV